ALEPALAINTLQIAPAACTSIMGSNGAGKSTLFKVITGQIKPTSGHVIVDNQDCRSLSVAQRARLISTVAQDPRLGTFEQLSIYENMAFAAARGEPSNLRSIFSRSQKTHFADRLRILELGLEDRLNTPAGTLSGGQRQALSLVMATLTTPKILLLDEPTAALDPTMATRVMEIVRTLTTTFGLTTVMITHDLAHAAQYSDAVIVMHSGKIVQSLNDIQKARLTVSDLAQWIHENSRNRAHGPTRMAS
ncbi:MAG TPA: ATP-binding cassette domain-containing protein, partial [Opitutales bacterium]|nr:ATP-binding cassette domain-containing protein [Opitutales bacterium]